MAEQNPAVANLLSAIGGEPPSPELSDLIGPPDPFIPPPIPARNPTGINGHSPGPYSDKPLNKTEATALGKETRSNSDPVAGMKKFGELAKLAGNGARVRVRKRLDSGHLMHIDDYGQRDVEFSGDLESFLNRYVKPKRGGGHYELALVDPRGNEHHVGIYLIDGPDITPVMQQQQSSTGDHVLGGIVRDLLNKPQPVPVDPFEQIKKAQSLMDSFAPKTPPSSNDAIYALMMESQRQSSAQMIALLQSKPTGPDPQILALLDRMDRRMEKLETAPPPPPPPPPMPQGPSYSIPELMTAGATLLASLIPLFKGEPGIKPLELVTLMQSAQAQTQTMMATLMGDRLTAKDMLALQKESNSGVPTLVDQMQQLAAVKQFANELSPQAPGPQGASFWDAIITLVGNPMVAEGLGARIASSGGTSAPQRVAVQDHGAHMQRQDPQFPPQNAQPQEERLALPDNFSELCKAIEAAPDDSSRAEATYHAIFSLRTLPQWQKFIENLLIAIAANDQPRAIGGLGQWFNLLAKHEHISSAAGDRAISTFDRHFMLVRGYMLEKLPALRRFAPEVQPGAAPVAPAAPAAAPVAPVTAAPVAAPVAPDEEDEEGDTPDPNAPATVSVDVPADYR